MGGKGRFEFMDPTDFAKLEGEIQRAGVIKGNSGHGMCRRKK